MLKLTDEKLNFTELEIQFHKNIIVLLQETELIYLVKIVCPSCEMKIEVGHEHFNKALDCPNCGSLFTMPDPNEQKDQISKLKKEIEILKNSVNTPQPPVSNFKRKDGTLKLGKADLLDDDLSDVDESLKKENEELKKKLEEANTMNQVLKEELSDTFKELEELKITDPMVETTVPEKETAVVESLLSSSETQQHITADSPTVDTAENHCIKCGAEISLNAKFCIICGAPQN